MATIKELLPLLLLLGVTVHAQLCCGQQGNEPSKATSLNDLINSIFNTTPNANGGVFGPDPSPVPSPFPDFQPSPTQTTILQPTPPTHIDTNTPAQEGKACGYEKECVPRHLCADGTILTNGETLIDIRSLDGECPYLEVCCDLPNKRNIPPVNPLPPVTHEGCGYRNPAGVGFRITGGSDNETEFGEFPWMMAILREEDTPAETLNLYECGGALIAPDVVITAAHCVQKYMPGHRFVVRAGEWDTQTRSEVIAHQDRSVSDVIVHEKYHKGALWNDIALLFLESPMEIAENVRPICLPPAGISFDFLRCYATGWGKDQFGREGKYQVILKKIDLPIVPHAQCQTDLRHTRLGDHFELHESFICAGGEKGKDTCKGDGGSPLVCPILGQPDRYYQAGIVAWGIGCGEENVPGVYASIAHLRPWIDQHLTAKRIDSGPYTA